MRKRRGHPGWFEAQGYLAMRNILVSYLGENTWMNTDRVLGAIQSGMDNAVRDYIKRRRHGRDGGKKI